MGQPGFVSNNPVPSSRKAHLSRTGQNLLPTKTCSSLCPSSCQCFPEADHRPLHFMGSAWASCMCSGSQHHLSADGSDVLPARVSRETRSPTSNPFTYLQMQVELSSLQPHLSRQLSSLSVSQNGMSISLLGQAKSRTPPQSSPAEFISFMLPVFLHPCIPSTSHSKLYSTWFITCKTTEKAFIWYMTLMYTKETSFLRT